MGKLPLELCLKTEVFWWRKPPKGSQLKGRDISVWGTSTCHVQETVLAAFHAAGTGDFHKTVTS